MLGKGDSCDCHGAAQGWKLTQALPDSVRDIWEAAPWRKGAPRNGHSNMLRISLVLTILSGMSSFSEAQDNLRILSDAKPGMLSQEEKQRLQGSQLNTIN